MYDIFLDWGLAGRLALVVGGLVLLIAGGESLIRGASRLAVAMRIPPLIVGLTVVAFCTSAPELAVSLNAALNGKADIAVGNVVGSNICNICLILGLAAVLRPIAVSSTLIRREIPLMIGVSILAYGFAASGGDGALYSIFEGTYEGRVYRLEGAWFVLILFLYILWTIREVRSRRNLNERYVEEIEADVVPAENDRHDKVSGPGNFVLNVCYLIVGIGMLVAGSDMLVQGASSLARSFGVSELTIGLTVLALGTSLPELVVSVLAAIRGKTDLAVGNVVGSNIFNILGVLGSTAILADGLDVGAKALQFDFPMMILVSVFCIAICITNRKISRTEGVFLLLFYAGYVGFLYMA